MGRPKKRRQISPVNDDDETDTAIVSTPQIVAAAGLGRYSSEGISRPHTFGSNLLPDISSQEAWPAIAGIETSASGNSGGLPELTEGYVQSPTQLLVLI